MPRTPRHRRGLTLLETVAAVVLLSLLAAAVLGALSSVVGQQTRQHRRVQAMELANRLMLQYLDDPNLMPQRNLPVAYGNDRFRWEAGEAPARIVYADPEVGSQRQSSSALNLDRIKAVTIHVWLGEESGGSMGYTQAVPSATIVRLMDPIAGLYRNPDTLRAMLQDDKRKREVLDMLRDSAAGGLVNRPAPAPGATGRSGDSKEGTVKPGGPKGGKGGTRPGRGGRRTTPAAGDGKDTGKLQAGGGK
ncbi:MAG: prepilin-type N-terminal cleavage/methylation domain-containing protein [Phycisphaerales bacterium]